jgi:type IX secretion system PorP/SprF family membrane protein
MQKIILFIIIMATAYSANAQSRLLGERSVYTQYFMTPFLVNPGATGQSDYGQVVANYRNAWATFPGSPRTVTIGYDGALGNRIGIGLIGVSDSYAAFSTTKGGLNLSYSIDMPNHKIGFGIAGEYVQHSLKGDALVNPIVDAADPLIVDRLNNNAYLDGSIGIYGTYMNKLTYGIALPSLISSKLNGGTTTGEKEIGYIASVAYRMEIPGKDVVFEPSVYAKKLMFVPFHVDINLKADFLNEKLTAGLIGSVGAEERIGFLVGTQLSNFGFHYTYNMSLQQFQNYNNGSHELSLKLRLQPYKRPVVPEE